MSVRALIERLVSRGMDPIDAAEVVTEAALLGAANASGPARSSRQERNARYYANRRLKASENKTIETVSDVSDAIKTASVGPSRTQVVTPSLPSLRSEELKPPVSPNGLTAPKGSETARGTRLADDWEPEGEDWQTALDLLGGDVGAVNELDRFRDYWRAVPGAKARKASWPATWRNWVRRASENSARKAPHERPHTDAKFEARQANLAAFERGADNAARFHGKP